MLRIDDLQLGIERMRGMAVETVVVTHVDGDREPRP